MSFNLFKNFFSTRDLVYRSENDVNSLAQIAVLRMAFAVTYIY